MPYRDALTNVQAIAAFMLDDGGGTTARLALGRCGADGTYTATGVTYGAFGPSAHIPRAVTFDGVAGGLTLPGIGAAVQGLSSSTSSQAWSAWVYSSTAIDSTTTAKWVFGTTTSGFAPMALGSATGSLANEVVTVVCDAGGAGRRTGWSGFTIPAGWHHHALVFDGTQNGWTYYLDGYDITLVGGSKISNLGGCLGFDGTHTYTVGVTSGTAFSVLTAAGLCIAGTHTPAMLSRIVSAGLNGFVVR